MAETRGNVVDLAMGNAFDAVANDDLAASRWILERLWPEMKASAMPLVDGAERQRLRIAAILKFKIGTRTEQRSMAIARDKRLQDAPIRSVADHRP